MSSSLTPGPGCSRVTHRPGLPRKAWRRRGAHPWQCISTWALLEENGGTTPCRCSKSACSYCSCWCRARRTSSACRGACHPQHRTATATSPCLYHHRGTRRARLSWTACLRLVAERSGRRRAHAVDDAQNSRSKFAKPSGHRVLSIRIFTSAISISCWPKTITSLSACARSATLRLVR